MLHRGIILFLAKLKLFTIRKLWILLEGCSENILIHYTLNTTRTWKITERNERFEKGFGIYFVMKVELHNMIINLFPHIFLIKWVYTISHFHFLNKRSKVRYNKQGSHKVCSSTSQGGPYLKISNIISSISISRISNIPGLILSRGKVESLSRRSR